MPTGPKRPADVIGNVEDVIVTGEEVDTTIETMAGKYLDHLLECPYCGIIRLQIPKDVQPRTPINCAGCREYLGTWDELQSDFERQGGTHGTFRLEKGRIQKLD
ncbi:hypothetical protein X739_28410 [Mesorhizobium sp. LNHC220B00]|uniref:hypothetical protein n=1 Tax=Mesorhizobium sp. LNHC229A00 TaxID=1287240 RepID=UPI0003CE0CB0|nr:MULTISPECIES: hypothetical protein [unclassified Mesorhizobium]ESY74155.1 hypothetical protein X741_34790 [Mesorhizobium sp. LNHC229A00]ESY81133.1 hypothetical protein X739_28410 [Mesorhizobium sp. LNHC220B00]